MDHSTLQKYLGELIPIIRYEIQQAQRPPNEVVLGDEDVMKMLQISKRTLQYLKTDGTLPFTTLRSRSYYLLSDILNLLKKNRIESVKKNIRIGKNID